MKVYESVNAAGEVQYVGITNNLERRAAEHLLAKGIKIKGLKGLESLSVTDAKAVEQFLIDLHCGPKGQPLYKINSMARTYPSYANCLRRGFELLEAIHYHF